MKRFIVQLTEDQVRSLRNMGAGNLAAGVRIANGLAAEFLYLISQYPQLAQIASKIDPIPIDIAVK